MEFRRVLFRSVAAYEKAAGECAKSPIKANADNATLHKTSATLAPLSEQSRDLTKDADHLYKLAVHAIDALNGEENGRELSRTRKDADDARKLADRKRVGSGKRGEVGEDT